MEVNTTALIIFQLAVLLFSIIIHEVSHGAVALYLGDDTAKRLGRLTLNPLKHLDPFGSIILPLVLSIPLWFGGTSIIVGWAKPVPYNPYNLKDPKKGAAIIGAAGPISNLIIAVTFALLLHIPLALGNQTLILAFSLIILLNILLAIFNLVPIPPLDGSKIFFAILPASSLRVQRFLEINGLFLLLAFIIFGLPLLRAVVFVVFNLLLFVTGIKLDAPL